MMWCFRQIFWLILLQLPSPSFNFEYRLPGNLFPEHYKVSIIYDLNEDISFAFFGAVEIELKVLRPTKTIVLHAADFIINNYDVRLKGYSSLVSNITVTRKNQMLYLELEDLMEPNSVYNLTIPFFGRLRKSDLNGVLVNSYYNEINNMTEYVVSTNFKPVYARRAFPCYDEPIFKAKFSLNIGHNIEYTAVSNMPVSNTTSNKNNLFTWHRFESTKVMSTYQVAFAITKYTRKESPYYKYVVNIWARNDSVNQATYAVTVTTKLLTYMEGWFNVPRAVQKLDIVAVPDSSFDCLESWGIIICSEALLFYDVDQSSVSHKRETLKVMARVLSRQWLGNLVTVVWWSDAWLFDGLVNYISSLSCDDAEPLWHCEDADTVDYMLEALKIGEAQNSLMIPGSINNEQRIMELHHNNVVLTSKGSLLFRMMFKISSESQLKKAIYNFLKKYSFTNAKRDDLMRELSAAGLQHQYKVTLKLKAIMDTWIRQPGYPLLTVNREHPNQTIYVSQKPYLPGASSTDRLSWCVPLDLFIFKTHSRQRDWLSNKEGVTSQHSVTHGAEIGEWLLLNKHMVAPYRVNYDEYNWKLLNATLHSTQYEDIPILNRVQLLSDTFALLWSKDIDFDVALEIFNYLKREIHYLPLLAGMKILKSFDTLLNRRPTYGTFQTFVASLIKPAYQMAGGLHTKKIMFKNDMASVEKQIMTSYYACYMKVPGCEENAVDLFQEWMNILTPDTVSPIPQELREIVFCAAAARGSIAEWRFLFNRMKKARDVLLKKDLLEGLTCTRDVWTLKVLLEWSIDDGSDMRRQDSGMVISSIMRSQVGYYIAKEFLMERIQDFHRAFSGHLEVISGIIKVMLEQFTTEKELNEFLEWKDAHFFYLSMSEVMMRQATEDARRNIAWLKVNEKKLIAQMLKVTRPAPARPVVKESLRESYSYVMYQSNARSLGRALIRLIIITLLVIRILFIELISL